MGLKTMDGTCCFTGLQGHLLTPSSRFTQGSCLKMID